MEHRLQVRRKIGIKCVTNTDLPDTFQIRILYAIWSVSLLSFISISPFLAKIGKVDTLNFEVAHLIFPNLKLQEKLLIFIPEPESPQSLA